MFSYNIQIKTGKLDIIKAQLLSISPDKSIQVLLITWGFGGLLEGMAGFGTAVAIPAVILISLGFKPIFSAVVSLIANSVATAFGAVGTPVIVLAREVGLSDQIREISMNVIIQLAVLMFIIPFVLLTLTNPKRTAIGKHIILSVAVGVVSLAVQYFSAKFIGAETPVILGSIASIIVIVLFGRIAGKQNHSVEKKSYAYSSKETIQAWSVYGAILIFILLASPLFPIREVIKDLLVSSFTFTIDDIPRSIHVYWLIDAGVLLFLGSIVGGIIQGATLKDLFLWLLQTLIQLKKTVITICCLIILSSIMDFAGMITVLGLSLANLTGAFYPLFAPLIGCLGTFLTGSDTSSNILFGKLQATVGDRINVDNSWLAAANTSGATGGKIISPQSISIANSACDLEGKEGEILKKVIPYAFAYIIIVGLVVYWLA